MDLRPTFLIDLETPIPDPFGLGAEAVAFIETLILPDGKRFTLVPEQRRIVEKIFGDVDQDGRRKADVAYLHLPSGNAKSTLAAACAFLCLAHPKFRILNGQLIIAAATREQARSTSFGIIQGFINRRYPDEDERALKFRVISNAVTQEIWHLPSGSSLKVLSRSPSAQEGLSVYFLLAEETHVWASQADRLWAVLRKSQAKVTADAPLAMIATTAGVGVGGIGHQLYQVSRDIAAGKVENPGWLPIIYEMEDGDDWRDEKVWRRLNFAIPTFKSLAVMRSLALEADTSATAKAEFLRYQLNKWAAGIGDPWLNLSTFDDAGEPFDLADIEHLPCRIGVDAGSTSDLTAVVAVFHDKDSGVLYALPFFWVPAESIIARSEQDSVPYVEWRDQSLIEETEGASIDEAAVEAKIRELCATYEVQQVGFDPWNTRRMMARLMEDDIPVVEVPQQYRTMSPAMKATERLILDRRFRHGGHPVLRWCFANVPMPRPTHEGNIKPSKSNSRSLKIDGAVASMMAVYLTAIADEEIIYDFRALTGRDPVGA
jgi:phage terminase large subunit-like protein